MSEGKKLLSKVAIVAPSLGSGGAERMILKLSKLMSQSFDVDFFVLSNRDNYLENEFKNIGVNPVFLGVNRKSDFFRAFYLLYKALKSSDPDVVHTWMYYCDLLGGLAGRMAGCKCILWSVRAGPLPLVRGNITAIVTRQICAMFSYFLCDAISYNSVASRKLHERLGYNKEAGEVVPNGFEVPRQENSLEYKASIRNQYGINDVDVVFGCVARWHPMKNHEAIIRAAVGFSVYSEKSFQLVFVGREMDLNNASLVELLDKYHIRHKVRLLGEVKNPMEVMNAFDFLLLPSSYGEAFPNVLGEAMLCGVPCVTSDVGDSAVIVGESGWVLDDPDHSSLLNALIACTSISNSEYIYRGNAGRRRIIEMFSMDSCYANFKKIYYSILDKN